MGERKSSDCSAGEDEAAARWDGDRKCAAGFGLDDAPPAHPNSAHATQCQLCNPASWSSSTNRTSGVVSRHIDTAAPDIHCCAVNTTDVGGGGRGSDRWLCERRTRRRLLEKRRGQQRRRPARRLMLLCCRRFAAPFSVSHACCHSGCTCGTAGIRHLRPAEQPDQVVAPRSIPGRCKQQHLGLQHGYMHTCWRCIVPGGRSAYTAKQGVLTSAQET